MESEARFAKGISDDEIQTPRKIKNLFEFDEETELHEEIHDEL